jgi:hypothetical protein
MLSCQRVFFVAAIFAILYIPLAYHSSQHVPPLTPRVNAAEGEKGKEKAKPKIEVVVDEFDPPSSYILEVKEDGRYVDPRKYSSLLRAKFKELAKGDTYWINPWDHGPSGSVRSILLYVERKQDKK